VERVATGKVVAVAWVWGDGVAVGKTFVVARVMGVAVGVAGARVAVGGDDVLVADELAAVGSTGAVCSGFVGVASCGGVAVSVASIKVTPVGCCVSPAAGEGAGSKVMGDGGAVGTTAGPDWHATIMMATMIRPKKARALIRSP